MCKENSKQTHWNSKARIFERKALERKALERRHLARSDLQERTKWSLSLESHLEIKFRDYIRLTFLYPFLLSFLVFIRLRDPVERSQR